jgi:RecJ-like exonuclease
MTALEVTIEDDEREERVVSLPARWAICEHCQGEGKSSAHLGAITAEEFYEDPDFKENYLEGLYDQPCGHCKGSGKVKVIDRGACTSEDQKAALKWLDDEAADKLAAFNERRTESLMLGETTLRDWDGLGPHNC